MGADRAAGEPAVGPERPSDEEILSRYRRWLLRTASEMLPGRPGEWQDLAQEGWIAMWRALRKSDPEKGPLAPYLTRAARWRMATVARLELWTGTQGAQHGHHRERPAQPLEPHSETIRRVPAPDPHDAVEMAYHEGEIRRALDELPPGARDAIVRRFWLDEPTQTGRWARHRARLAERLGHLRDTS